MHTFAFSFILDAAALLGITDTPLSICYLMQIWALLLIYFFAIFVIFGSLSKLGSPGFALSGEPNEPYAVTKEKIKCSF